MTVSALAGLVLEERHHHLVPGHIQKVVEVAARLRPHPVNFSVIICIE